MGSGTLTLTLLPDPHPHPHQAAICLPPSAALDKLSLAQADRWIDRWGRFGVRVVGTQASIYLSIHLSIYLSIAQAEVGRSFGAVESKAFATYTTPVLNALAHTQAHANAHAHAPAPAPALT